MNAYFSRPTLSTPPVVLALILTAVAAVSAVLLVAGQMLGLPVEQLTADPAVTFNAHPITGGISFLGMLFWCAAATVCLFTGMVLSRTGSGDRLFLLASGGITFMLLVDDLYMFHEAIFPWYFGIPQWAVYTGYLLVLAGWLYYYRENLLRTPYRYLIVAVTLLGCSAAGDFVLPQEGIWYLLEDLFKLFGITCWFFYMALVCTLRLRKQLPGNRTVKSGIGKSETTRISQGPHKEPAGTAAPAG